MTVNSQGDDKKLLQQAMKALGVTVPFYRYEIAGNKVTLWLYGRSEPVTWTKPASKQRKTKKLDTASPHRGEEEDEG